MFYVETRNIVQFGFLTLIPGFGNRNERSGEARRRLRAAFMNGEENDSTDEWIPVNMSESSGSLDFNEISGDDGNDDDDDDDNMMWVTDSD